MGQPFPALWTTAFDFVGLSVLLSGDECQPWSLQFECRADPGLHLFTCYVEDGKPSYVGIAG